MSRPTDLCVEQTATCCLVWPNICTGDGKGDSERGQPWQKVYLYNFHVWVVSRCAVGGKGRWVCGGGVAFHVIVLKILEDSSTNLSQRPSHYLALGLATPLCLCPLLRFGFSEEHP